MMHQDQFDDLHCQHCGYQLRGLPEERCPECGHGFDPFERRFWNRHRWRGLLIVVCLIAGWIVLPSACVGCLAWSLSSRR